MKLPPTFSKNKNWFQKPVAVVLLYHFYKRQDTKKTFFFSLIIFTDLNNIAEKKNMTLNRIRFEITHRIRIHIRAYSGRLDDKIGPETHS